ncbi:mechanosensitive ion channel family protein [Ancylobacter terrae]|uniref:mechanosensitive ion channel family protein n=1 Tax=Ancylobacter sp. sgz301288 TaxID=3342077 RepID=UPI00385C638D
MKLLRAALSALLLVMLPFAAMAQTPPAPLTQQQFDQLVDSLSKAVAERLHNTAPAPSAPAEPAKPAATAGTDAPMMAMSHEEPVSEVFIGLLERGDDILLASPGYISQLARVPSLLTADRNGGRTPGLFILQLIVAVIVTLATELGIRAVCRPLRHRLAGQVIGAPGLWALFALLALDAVGLVALWLVVHSFVITWFPQGSPQSQLGYLALTTLFYWRLYATVFRVILRPSLSQARLADIGDDDARQIYRWVSAAILLAIVLADIRRILDGMRSTEEVIAFTLLLNSTVMTTLFIVTAVRLRAPVARWIRGESRQGRPGPVLRALAHSWLGLAIPVLLMIGLTRIHGALTGRTGAVEALVATVNVVVGLLLLETLMDKTCRLLEGELQQVGSKARERAIEAVMRCVRVALFIGAGALLVRIWAVDGVGMMEMSRYNAVAAAALPAGAILFGAYCAWQAVEYFTGLYRTPAAGVPGLQDPDDAAATTVSRVATLMPLLRVALIIAIVVMAGLTVLSQLGINITPLIAGASIIGLAISFGSQTLVKDIVSGVFYLVDDAFRVGEYIDCGKAKGTVEGFTLRSLKLRHQNGMVHTIPFGQLGQITNFSRDWSTLKFNLRFTRDTDLEKLRKAVKKIGQEMLEDPEMKDEFLTPLKMQGVADIADSALIVRFKFTVKPSKPTFIQREAIKRMIRTLPQQGIEFANATVAVQALGGGDTTAAAAAARAKAVSDQAIAAAQEAASA